MKSMLYLGSALMIGASIYGFVDYKQTANRKEFKTMYEPAKNEIVSKTEINNNVKPAVVTDVNTSNTASVKKEEVKKVTAKEKKPIVKKKKKRKLDYRSFSRAPLREEIEVVEPVKEEPKKSENKEQ